MVSIARTQLSTFSITELKEVGYIKIAMEKISEFLKRVYLGKANRNYSHNKCMLTLNIPPCIIKAIRDEFSEELAMDESNMLTDVEISSPTTNDRVSAVITNKTKLLEMGWNVSFTLGPHQHDQVSYT